MRRTIPLKIIAPLIPDPSLTINAPTIFFLKRDQPRKQVNEAPAGKASPELKNCTEKNTAGRSSDGEGVSGGVVGVGLMVELNNTVKPKVYL